MVSWSESFEVTQPSIIQDSLVVLTFEFFRDMQITCVLQTENNGLVKRKYGRLNA
jgi:hypothetical protein